MDTSLTPTDLFSPSKARQQRAQAQDWAHIESWLSYKYAGKTIPNFERNQETLKALRALATANERADEERALIARVEREALKELEEQRQLTSADKADIPSSDAQILDAISSHLTPEAQRNLTVLATTSVALDTPDTDPETLAHALIHHTTTAATLSTQLDSLHTLQTYLHSHLASLRTDLTALHSPTFSPPTSLPRQTTDWTRQTKHLRTKLREYEDRLASLSPPPPPSLATTLSGIGRGARPPDPGSAAGIAQLVELEEALEGLRARVEELEAQKEGARREVRRLEGEVERARRRRDGLFEGLVER
ncbi:hypothetical protein AOQ84DRAFT_433158 [Glonium stellatum]|uniref:HAUS augmin-like complex subunit 1 n=1 Tax=Glonium stellatum TaxID=574774 RepID=A0A8E2EUI2_9PEZI|nr:hypothetical protein AOQ84DRAFT_433158 [Glonium stellatum]